MVFLVNMARIVFAPLLEPFRATFPLSAGEAGLIATLAWLGSALPRLPTGYLLTKVPRHRVVLGTGVLLTGSAVFTALSGSVPMLYVGALFMGLASGAYFIAANPLISELYPDRIGRVIGVHGTASQIAAVLAPGFVTVVLAVSGWRQVFWLIAFAAALATATMYLVARGTTMPSAGESDRNLLVALRRQWPIILSGVGILGATGFVWNGVFNFYVTYLVATKTVSNSVANTLLTVVFASGVPAFWFTGRLADRVPKVPLMLSILAGFVISLVALTMTSSLWAVALISAVIGFVIHSLFPVLDTYLLGSLPDDNRASAYAIYSATMMLVSAAGSVALGSLRNLGFGFDFIFRGAAIGLAGIFLVLLVLNRFDRLPAGGS
ncbi:MAG: DHA1 family inner membrane transport protein [Halobacteriales archaeon]|jgi:DHA1 family inner membrane transport protein